MNRRTKTAVIVALLVGAFFTFGALGWFRPVTIPATEWVSATAMPLYRVVGAVSLALGAGEMRQAQNMPGSDIDVLRVENARLRALVSENQALKDALGYRERFDGTMLTAQVASRTADDIFHGLLIDRGSDDGVRVGQAVVVGNGVIVGKVAAVKARTAAVMLLTDSRSRLAVTLQNIEGTVGVLQGDRGTSFAVGLIPQSETVSPGDSVVSSGLEPGIRRGLVVGTITTVTREAQEPFQTASVIAPPGSSSPTFVQILLSPTIE